jgi:aryl-alcohol dehydrogenase-like predicted oxidoreductase
MHCWDPVTPIEESLRTFDDLVRQGKVRYIGVSNFKAWQLMKALGLSDQNGWASFIAAQYQYSLVERNIEPEFRDLCMTEGVGIVPWGPLGGGFLTGKYRRDRRPSYPDEGRIAVMEEDTEEAWSNRNKPKNWEIMDVIDEIVMYNEGTTHSQIAISWLLAQPGVDSVIVGVRTLEQLNDNMSASKENLSKNEIKRLDDVSTLDPVYPYGFINKYGTRE